MKVFIDTGFWIAYLDRNDAYHETAQDFMVLALSEYELSTSNFVVHETITYLNSSLKSHSVALLFLDTVDAACEVGDLQILNVDLQVEQAALDMFRRYDDKHFSFTDCTSFACMQQHNIELALGFDEHFTQMGFVLEP